MVSSQKQFPLTSHPIAAVSIRPPKASNTEELQAPAGPVVKWIRTWELPYQVQTILAVVNRWLIEVDEDWVAVVTASLGDDMAMKTENSLQHAEPPDCYWLIIRPVLSSPCHECES